MFPEFEIVTHLSSDVLKYYQNVLIFIHEITETISWISTHENVELGFCFCKISTVNFKYF